MGLHQLTLLLRIQYLLIPVVKVDCLSRYLMHDVSDNRHLSVLMTYQ